MKESKGRKTIYSKEYQDLAKKLKEARIKAGLTQVQAAKKLKRPQSYISKIENSQYYLDIFELRDVLRIYKRTIDYVIKT